MKKKVDKEIDSSKSKDYISHAKKEESRSVGRNHRHSLRHSVRRLESSQILSPVRKHKRRSGVNELQGEMRNIKPPTFGGEHKKYEDAREWMLGMRKDFQL
jgi:hypothetical protein